jgi:OOP family OmpA-OmpF porin
MRQYRLVAVAGILSLALSGCAGKRFGPCGVAGGLIGATAGAIGGGVGVDQYENNPSNVEIAGGAGAGFVVGALVGSALGHLICDPPKEVPPPPPAAAAPPPPPPPPPKGTKIATVGEAHFDFDKAELKPSARDVLDEAVKTMQDNPTLRVVVEGHADSIGSEAYNQRLSERRAEAVKRFLVQRGVESSRIETRGFGETKPIASNDTKAGRAENRRAEIIAD